MSNFAIKAKAKEIHLKGPMLSGHVLEAMRVLSQIVGSTLGPGGNVVLMERIGLPPLASKDGVTVAVNCTFFNATQHVVAEAAKEAALRTNTEAGDGTTTAIVLAEALVREGTDFLKANPGKSPQELCRELDVLVDQVVKDLQSMARPVESNEDLLKVATVSANFDESIAKAVVEAIDMVGNNGTIITEEGSSRETTVDIQDGFPVRKGLNSFGAIQEIFINNPQDQDCSLSNPLIMLYDGDLNDPIKIGAFLGGCLEKMMETKDIRPVVVVAHKFGAQVLEVFARNFMENRFQMIPMETSYSAQPNSRHHFLHDLAAYVGADVLDPIGNTLDKASIESLGGCGRVKIGRYSSVFLDPLKEAEPLVEKRRKELEGQLANAESEYDTEIVKERIGHLLGGIATIYVGGSSDLEVREKKHRIEDAICATRSAIEQGILPGGGSALLVAGHNLLNSGPAGKLLLEALASPFYRILTNSGDSLDAATETASRVLNSQTNGMPGLVWDALHHKMVDPYEAGIVDPVKVTVSALRNAYSIAQMLFTLGGAIVLPRDLAEERMSEVQAQGVAEQMQGA